MEVGSRPSDARGVIMKSRYLVDYLREVFLGSWQKFLFLFDLANVAVLVIPGLATKLFGSVYVARSWVGISLFCSFFLANVGLYLRVRRDYEAMLANYEFQAPEYEIEVRDIYGKVDQQRDYVYINWKIRFFNTTPWDGFLNKILIGRGVPLHGLGEWTHTQGPLAGGFSSKIVSPDEPLRHPECVVFYEIRAKVCGRLDLAHSEAWRSVLIPMSALVFFRSRAGEPASKFLEFVGDVNLEEALELIVSHQNRDQE